ncbi:MAG: hypothetical protein ACKO32_11450 [Planctomycetia bacterium]|jgi:hypothetical protein
MEEQWIEELPEEARAGAKVVNELTSSERTCPACLTVFAAGPKYCPSCRLFIGG